MALTPTTFLQATGPYTGKQTRFALGAGSPVQTGVFKTHTASPLLVTQQSTAALAVDIAPGGAVFRENQSTGAGIAGTVAAPGVYSQLSDSVTSFSTGITAGHATLPRIDQIFMAVHDTTDAGDATNAPEFRVVPGTATSGATLDNRNGAASDASIAVTLGQNWIRLADILMPATSTTVLAANIRDRRRWAFGLSLRLSMAATVAGISAVLPALTNPLTGLVRAELSGCPIEITGSVSAGSASAAGIVVAGLVRDGTYTASAGSAYALASSSTSIPIVDSVAAGVAGNTAGSHTFGLYGYRLSGGPTWTANAGSVVVREIPVGYGYEGN